MSNLAINLAIPDFSIVFAVICSVGLKEIETKKTTSRCKIPKFLLQKSNYCRVITFRILSSSKTIRSPNPFVELILERPKVAKNLY